MRKGRFACASAVAMCALTSVGLGGVAGCKKKAKVELVADAAPPAPQVPAPFTAIKIGMSAADLGTAFPSAEPTEKCKAQLVGGDAPLGPLPPTTLNGAHARCARALEVGGLAESEKKLIHERTTSKRTESEAADFERAWVYTTAQIRGAVRAGQLDERAVFDAASGEAQTTAGAVAIVAGKLTTGSRVFSLPRNNGRPICACIADSCDDMDPDRVRRYVEGGFSLGQLDADAHSRVVNGKCRGTYLRNERALQRKFVFRTGGLAAIGLARAAQSDRALDPNKRSTFVTFSGRSKLDEATSKVGVLLANSVFKAESYWAGTIALVPAPDAAQVWGAAVVWLQDGRVSRIMVNIADQSKLGDLPKTLEADYGKPSASAGTVTSWQLPNGLVARLDVGASMSLVVEAGSGAPAEDGGTAQPNDR